MPRKTKPLGSRRSAPQQIDLFAKGPRAGGMPTWTGLPAQTQTALIALITRLMLDHADKNRINSVTGADHDL